MATNLPYGNIIIEESQDLLTLAVTRSVLANDHHQLQAVLRLRLGAYDRVNLRRTKQALGSIVSLHFYHLAA